jgi:hypothetical protein
MNNMLQLILHGIGDYFLQTDYQATTKKKSGSQGLISCLTHCLTYSAPFLLIGSWQAVIAIFITHFFIDRTNFVAYLIAIKNNTKKPPVPEGKMGWSFPYNYDISNFGFSKDRPFAITIWLYIICDNLMHIICNYFALKYL